MRSRLTSLVGTQTSNTLLSHSGIAMGSYPIVVKTSRVRFSEGAQWINYPERVMSKQFVTLKISYQASLYRRGSGTGCNPVALCSGGSTPSRRTLGHRIRIRCGEEVISLLQCGFESRPARLSWAGGAIGRHLPLAGLTVKHRLNTRCVKGSTTATTRHLCLRSAAVAQQTLNLWVVGSNPTGGTTPLSHNGIAADF